VRRNLISYNCKKHRIGLEPMSSGRTDSSDVVGIVPGKRGNRKLEVLVRDLMFDSRQSFWRTHPFKKKWAFLFD
jgi:hypothetical protein